MWKMTLSSLLVLLSSLLLLVFAEPRLAQNTVGAAQPPYIFLTVPRDHSSAMVHGFEVIQAKKNEKGTVSTGLVADNGDYDDNEFEEEENNDNERVNDDSYGNNVYSDISLNEDDEEEDYEHAQGLQERNPVVLKIEAEEDLGFNFDSGDDNDGKPKISIMNVGPTSVKRNNLHFVNKNRINKEFIKSSKHQTKSTNMMMSHKNAGAVMVPDGIIEIEGQAIFDKKSGKTTLLVPRSALDAIPNGSVVALMERSMDAGTDTEEERANRVIVRRRRKGSRRNVRRRSGSGSRRRRGSKRGSRRKNVRVVQVGGNRRRGLRRRQRPLYVQG